jgi:L-alanine-DL-glutamate epimerase-like enolase superfamily enzyme
MKITGIKVSILESDAPQRMYDLVTLPGQHRERWMHAAQQRVGARPPSSGSGSDRKAYEFVMHVETDEGVEGICTAVSDGASHLDRRDLEQVRRLVIGQNPFDRELLYQKLHQGTRWLYRAPGWFGAFDNCLWDIAGKVAGLPVYALLGRVREKTPAYYNIRGVTIEEAVEDAQRALSEGFTAVKDHFYHPANENIRWLEATRRAVGPDVPLMHDCVGIYTFNEAVKVGKALEELDYLWFEEPLPERQHNRLAQLCARLDIPVLATEMFMYDIDLCAQWLISGATDLIRNNARHGTTHVMKLAHLAELHGTTIELNGVGGLWGLVHAHLLCAIQNTSYYEYFPGGWHDESGRNIGMMNPVVPEKGFVRPPEEPGWGAEWDWRQFKKRTVEVW